MSEDTNQPMCACLRITYKPKEVMLDVPATTAHPAHWGPGSVDRWTCDLCGTEFVRAALFAERRWTKAEVRDLIEEVLPLFTVDPLDAPHVMAKVDDRLAEAKEDDDG
jgi:hypothetical protein